MQPRPESRISALEALTSTHTAHILELAADTDQNFRSLKQDIKHLSDDMIASFKQSAEYQVAQEQIIETRFDKLETRFDKLEPRFDKLETRFDKLETRFDKLETRFDKLESAQDELKATQDEHSVLLREILARLPKPA